MTPTTKPEPSPIDTTILEGIRNYDGVIARKLEGIAPVLADVRENMLDLGEQLLKLREAVNGNTKTMGIHLHELDLRASKDIRADAQKMARAVRGGKTREEVLALPAREIRLLSPDFSRAKSNSPTADEQAKPAKTNWRAIAEQALAKIAAEKVIAISANTNSHITSRTPTSFGGLACLSGAALFDFSRAESNEAPSTTEAEDHASGAEKPAGELDDAAGISPGWEGISDASEAAVWPATGGAGIADEGGVTGSVGGAANGDSSSLKATIRALIEPEIATWKKPRDHIEYRVDMDTSGKNRVQALLFKIMDLVAA